MAELVSILIPAYHERFFGEAFASALAQDYPDFEVVVCDDSPGTAIEQRVRAADSPRVRYRRNPQRLGFHGNFTQCLREAQGDLIKFLNDDDRLRPDCIATFARMFGTNPAITLATSRRCVIDEAGHERPAIAPTAAVSHVSALMPGRELGDFVLANSLNFIGEPTTAMFRRSHLQLEDGMLFRWGGFDYHCLADISLWLRVLARGVAYYHAACLSDFRLHPGQEQDTAEMHVACFEERLWIARQARTLRFLATPRLWQEAMRSLRARSAAFDPIASQEAGVRRRVERVLAEIDAELAASNTPVARPL
jgi:glycosyltransferase involved in cell wall biosynthesis